MTNQSWAQEYGFTLGARARLVGWTMFQSDCHGELDGWLCQWLVGFTHRQNDSA